MNKFFEIAAAEAIKGQDRNHYLGAVGIRADGVIVKSRNNRTPTVCRYAHAEYRLAKKLTPGSIVFLCRVISDGSYGCSKPCHSCMKILRTTGVKKVYYTDYNNVISSITF